MEFDRCYGCMEKITGSPCPLCGMDPGNASKYPYALQPGTILNGKFVVGKVLGQGGFGITYIGWDLALENKVAIKEYYPSASVSRTSASSVIQWYNTDSGKAARDSGKEMFLKEARKMSRVSDIPQVVRVRDLFQQNDTAYIVMDFVEGQTLKDYLKQHGVLTWEEAQKIFFPAINGMAQVHQSGLIHRDLSPDNLMLLPNGKVRILDLGAAKDLNLNSGASSMQVAKGGFSPAEQYVQRGGSGTWTDVYAMAATLYYSLTGKIPTPSVDRMMEDTLPWNLPQLQALPEHVLEALKKAMAIQPKNRTQTMEEFEAQLNEASKRRQLEVEPPCKQQSAPAKPQQTESVKPAAEQPTPPKKPKFGLYALAAVGIVAVIALAISFGKGPEPPESAPTQEVYQESRAPETEQTTQSTDPVDTFFDHLTKTGSAGFNGLSDISVHEYGRSFYYVPLSKHSIQRIQSPSAAPETIWESPRANICSLCFVDDYVFFQDSTCFLSVIDLRTNEYRQLAPPDSLGYVRSGTYGAFCYYSEGWLYTWVETQDSEQALRFDPTDPNRYELLFEGHITGIDLEHDRIFYQDPEYDPNGHPAYVYHISTGTSEKIDVGSFYYDDIVLSDGIIYGKSYDSHKGWAIYAIDAEGNIKKVPWYGEQYTITGGRGFFAESDGSFYSVDLNGSNKQQLSLLVSPIPIGMGQQMLPVGDHYIAFLGNDGNKENYYSGSGLYLYDILSGDEYRLY